MTFLEFKNYYYNNILPNKPTYIRKGQSLMNFLSEVWIAEYKRLASVHYYDQTNIDCFSNDSLVQNTLKHLEQNWYHYPF